MSEDNAPDVAERLSPSDRLIIDQLNRLASDMGSYERKDETIARLRRQRNAAIRLARSLIIERRQHLMEKNDVQG